MGRCRVTDQGASFGETRARVTPRECGAPFSVAIGAAVPIYNLSINIESGADNGAQPQGPRNGPPGPRSGPADRRDPDPGGPQSGGRARGGGAAASRYAEKGLGRATERACLGVRLASGLRHSFSG